MPTDPQADRDDDPGQAAPPPVPQVPPPGPRWRLDLLVRQESAASLAAKIMAERPRWDPHRTPGGLAVGFQAPAGAPGPDPGSAPDLALIRDLSLRLGRGRPLIRKAVLAWLPGPAPAPPVGLGPFRLAGPSVPAAEPGSEPGTEPGAEPGTGPAAGGPGARLLAAPPGFDPSPRLRACLSLAMTAVAGRLNPPPGAPETRGARTLVVDGEPALLAAAALAAGSGPVTAACPDEGSAANVREAARLNSLPEGALEIRVAGLPPWPREAAREWAGAFDLVVVNLSVHLAVRLAKDLAACLAPRRGRLIATGLGRGQASQLVRAAGKAGLALMDTSVESGWTVVVMGHRRPDEFPVLSWSPGDWVSELNEDDREALARLDAMDTERRLARAEAKAAKAAKEADGPSDGGAVPPAGDQGGPDG